jgi:DNA polymerase-1
MVAAFVNKEDIHTRTSLELFNSKEKKLRRIAKVINFGLSYGMSATGVMENLNATADPEKGIDYVTEEQAQSYLDRFHARYPRVMGFCAELWQDMRSHRVPQFTNCFGRTRRLPEIAANDYTKHRAERQAVASIIQGTAADIAKQSMVRVVDRLDEARAAGRYDGQFVLTVHDENQMDVRSEHAEEAARELKRDMEFFPQFAPIEITAEAEWSTTTWADKHSIWKEAA